MRLRIGISLPIPSHGRLMEGIAAWYLRFRGFRILRQNYRHPLGEIDIIAMDGNCLVAIEVKKRQRLSDAAYALRISQQKRIMRSLLAYRQQHPQYALCAVRFDVVLLAPYRFPFYIRHAFEV